MARNFDGCSLEKAAGSGSWRTWLCTLLLVHLNMLNLSLKSEHSNELQSLYEQLIAEAP